MLIYLNKQSKSEINEEHSYSKPQTELTNSLPKHLNDHNYCTPTNNIFTVDQQYADDIGWASTGIHILEQIEKDIPEVLESRNLFVNESKTEKYEICRGGNDEWKSCKYVGSNLETEKDIQRRIKLANAAFSTLKTIFNSNKISKNIKLRIFQALVESIFLYNSEVWGTNKKQNETIDTFQRRLLRNILGIKWRKNNWIINKDLYERTGHTEWSKVIAYRRLRFFGHIARLDEKAPAKVALYEAIRTVAIPPGRPKTTLLGVIRQQLKELRIPDFHEAINRAQDRDIWRNLIT